MMKQLKLNDNLFCKTYLFGIIMLLFTATGFMSHAHNLGEGYIFLKIHESGIEGWAEFTLNDLNTAIGLDKDMDGKVSEKEINAKLDTVKDYVLKRLKFNVNDSPIAYTYKTHQFRNVSSAKYLMLHFDLEKLPDNTKLLGVDYSVFFDSDPKQRGLLVVEENSLIGLVNKNEEVSLIFTPERTQQQLDLTGSSKFHQFALFIWQGIWHIWIGIDHILFIITLILISVVTRVDGKWKPVASFSSALWNLIKILTLFTIAHSITLGLAAMGIISLSSRIVESVIALSVAIAALNNLIPIFGRRDWLIIFCFGLFHGMGFASVLGHLIYSKQSLVIALLGFNVGVEIGQIAIVILTFPILYAICRKKFYSPVVVKFGSVVIGIIALLWFTERAFELDPIIGIF